MKIISVNLQPVNNIGSGISTFANELINILDKHEEIKILGCFNCVRGVTKNSLNRFPFKIHYSFIPYKLVYCRCINKDLPLPYKWISGVDADINLFFTYRIPRVRYRGLVISTIHDIIPIKTEMENKNISAGYMNDIKYTASNSDFIITVSENSKKDIIDLLNFPKSRIIVIPNGVDFEKFNMSISEAVKWRIKEKYALPDHFILYMGGMRKHKNVDNLILAYKKLPIQIRSEIKLVITSGTDSLRRLVRDNNLDEYVLFIPFVEEDDKVAVYQLADIFSYISLYEGFGIPILEAQASSTPVIASSVSSLPEVCGNNGAVIVNPLDLDDICKGLLNLIQDKELRLNCIKHGIINAKEYSWMNAGKKLLEFLNSLYVNKYVG